MGLRTHAAHHLHISLISCYHETGKARKRASIGENEKKCVIDSYNCCQGKDWKDVLLFVRKRVLEAGLPDHVVRMYLELSSDRMIQRMRNIAKNVLRSRKTLAGKTKQGTQNQ